MVNGWHDYCEDEDWKKTRKNQLLLLYFLWSFTVAIFNDRLKEDIYQHVYKLSTYNQGNFTVISEVCIVSV